MVQARYRNLLWYAFSPSMARPLWILWIEGSTLLADFFAVSLITVFGRTFRAHTLLDIRMVFTLLHESCLRCWEWVVFGGL